MSNMDKPTRDDAQLEQALAALRERRPGAPPHLRQKIIANLPQREPVADFVDWLRASAWRSVTVAALPLLLGFVLGVSLGSSELDSADSILFAENWEAYEADEI